MVFNIFILGIPPSDIAEILKCDDNDEGKGNNPSKPDTISSSSMSSATCVSNKFVINVNNKEDQRKMSVVRRLSIDEKSQDEAVEQSRTWSNIPVISKNSHPDLSNEKKASMVIIRLLKF